MPRHLVSVALGLLVVMRLAAPASASWGANASGSSGARSTTVTAPGALTVSCSSTLAASLNADWVASSTPWVTQYEVRWGTNPASPTGSSVVSGLSFTTPALGLGTWYVTVRAAKGAWRSPPSNQPSRLIISVLGAGACV
jgi:hypothetical protein